MAKRLRHRAHNIDWTPEPIKPELLHSFRLPSIASLSHPYDNDSDLLRPAEPPFDTIPMPRPSLTIKNNFSGSRKAPAFCHPDRPPPFPSNAGGIPSSRTEGQRGKKNDLKGENRKQPGTTLLIPCKIPRSSKRRRRGFDDPRQSRRIGWVSSGGVVPWAMAAHTSLSERSVLTRGKKTHSINAVAADQGSDSMALDGGFELGSLVMEMCGKRKLSVSLLSEEIEEDFVSIIGEMPAPRLNKRDREMQSQLDNLFPGMCFMEPEKCLAGNSA